MTNEIPKRQRNPEQGKIHELLYKHSEEDHNKINPKRERWLAMLKKKYGYTNEKAVEELERLLKQFYSVNKSIGVYRRGVRSITRRSPGE